jgi:Tfp pilus assembly protein PilF
MGEEIYNSKAVEEWIELAGQAADEGDLEKTREYLRNAVKADPECAKAWDYLSHFAQSKDDEIYALEKVLELQPDNQNAAERLQFTKKFTH